MSYPTLNFQQSLEPVLHVPLHCRSECRTFFSILTNFQETAAYLCAAASGTICALINGGACPDSGPHPSLSAAGTGSAARTLTESPVFALLAAVNIVSPISCWQPRLTTLQSDVCWGLHQGLFFANKKCWWFKSYIIWYAERSIRRIWTERMNLECAWICSGSETKRCYKETMYIYWFRYSPKHKSTNWQMTLTN